MPSWGLRKGRWTGSLQLETKRLFKRRKLQWLLSELCGLSSACGELASACPVQQGPLLLNPRWWKLGLPKGNTGHISNSKNISLRNLIPDPKSKGFKSMINIFVYLFIFNQRIIALQNCVGFCHISTWISNRYTFVPSLLNLPSTSHFIPPLQVVTESPFECPESYRKFPLAIYFTDYSNILFFNWSRVDLQCYVSFKCIAKWISYTYTYTSSF